MKRTMVTLVLLLFCMTGMAQQMFRVNVGNEPDGQYEEMIGSVKVTGEVKNGLKQGTWTEFHPNMDMPYYIIQYKDGKKDGLYIEIDRQACISKKIEYKNDLIEGVLYEWTRGGRLAKKQEYKDGKLNGKTTLYYERGFLQEESEYKDGKRNGVTIWYAYGDKEQGNKIAMYTYVDGLFEGVQEVYYEDGRLSSSKMFSNNVQNGLSIEYYEDGSVMSESNYVNGKLKGKVKEYKKGSKFID